MLSPLFIFEPTLLSNELQAFAADLSINSERICLIFHNAMAKGGMYGADNDRF